MRSVGGASIELLRAVSVVFAVSLLLLVVGLATCAVGRPGSVVDEVPAAVKQEAGPPRWAALPHAVRMYR